MFAVVYSGSNYADWRLADKGRTVASFKTPGINPQFHDQRYILQLLNKNINLIHHAEEIKRIYFFGAGASSEEMKTIVKDALSIFFINSRITVEHDIQAAGIACCKKSPGIVSVCGSGSNAAWYDGKKIKPNNYGLGYILADEGSGNWLGRQLIKGYMNDTLPESIKKKFVRKYEPNRKTLLDKIYRQKQPAVFLNSFTEFYVDNLADSFISDTVNYGFSLLVNTYIIPLKKQHPDARVYFAGSVAETFQDHLREAAAQSGIEIANIIREPINNLLNYYSNKN